MKNIKFLNTTMFSVPLFCAKVEPWQEIKKQILDCIEGKSSYRMDYGGYITDFDTKSKSFDDPSKFNSYSSEVYNILKPWIRPMCESLIGKELPSQFPHIWTQKYYSNLLHPVHNHGNRGYSFILYLKFIPKEHPATLFYGPHENFFNGDLLTYVPDVQEGDLIAFPSVIRHTSQVHYSEKERMILSFNLWQN